MCFGPDGVMDSVPIRFSLGKCSLESASWMNPLSFLACLSHSISLNFPSHFALLAFVGHNHGCEKARDEPNGLSRSKLQPTTNRPTNYTTSDSMEAPWDDLASSSFCFWFPFQLWKSKRVLFKWIPSLGLLLLLPAWSSRRNGSMATNRPLDGMANPTTRGVFTKVWSTTEWTRERMTPKVMPLFIRTNWSCLWVSNFESFRTKTKREGEDFVWLSWKNNHFNGSHLASIATFYLPLVWKWDWFPSRKF